MSMIKPVSLWNPVICRVCQLTSGTNRRIIRMQATLSLLCIDHMPRFIRFENLCTRPLNVRVLAYNIQRVYEV
jgi:hypothetical protein